MISIVGVLFLVVFVLVFFGVFFTIFTGFWRMRGMANKVFTLAEQEMDRKLREGPANGTEATPDPAICSHCGSRVTAQVAQCPNCSAGLP